MSSGHGFETRAIHSGQAPDPSHGSVVPPIHLTSTFAQTRFEADGPHTYSRVSNPTRNALEECLAALEGGTSCAAFASGMAASQAIFQTLSPGDGVVAGSDLYGGTYRLLEQVYKRWGLEVRYAADNSAEAYAAALASLARPRLVWLESPTNPLLFLTDIEAVCAVAKAKGCLVAVDNTFASPYLQRPLELGADLVMHSTTKYLGGHSDIVGGAVIARRPEDMELVRFQQKAAGAIPSPFEAWLLQRGVKTLAVRMERHCDNAEAFAEALRGMTGVAKVFYPGFADHPGHAIAARQMRRFGGMVAAELTGGVPAVRQLVENVKFFSYGESLGGVESLLSHPASMSHASLPREERLARGIGDGLVRFSVGIETVDDLIGDVRQALRS
ncbi:MAG: cystathionine gamma-synthase [Candidatus Sumerlaeota bacterium]|nr:cystathionine gamma-synthase [Candidatus Sumerlaeota bacterium]